MIFSAPETMLMLLWFLWCLMAVLAWLNVYRFHVREKRYERRNKNKDAHTPTAVVIIAIKGVNDHLHTLLDGMLTQDYPRYRIIFIVETKQDPTFTFLRDMIDNWADVTATESVPLDTSSVRMAGEEPCTAVRRRPRHWSMASFYRRGCGYGPNNSSSRDLFCPEQQS